MDQRRKIALAMGAPQQPQIDPMRREIISAMMGSPARAAATPQPLPQMGTGAATSYTPSLRDRLGNMVYDAAEYVGLPNANRMRNEASAAVDFIPGVGDAVGLNEAARDFGSGNYGMAAAGLGATMVGAVPGVGDGLKAIMDEAAAKGVDLYLSAPRGRIVLDKIVVPKEMRGTGVGSEIMKKVVDFADQSGLPVSLTPTSDFGGSKPRLEKFYKKFGFEANTGRSRDFEISEAMKRYPQR